MVLTNSTQSPFTTTVEQQAIIIGTRTDHDCWPLLVKDTRYPSRRNMTEVQRMNIVHNPTITSEHSIITLISVAL
ncbi:hypothetical protein V3481_017884 [Fusarium oxysporum f. sp. vasinfectum]